jgi:hypothetical protein
MSLIWSFLERNDPELSGHPRHLRAHQAARPLPTRFIPAYVHLTAQSITNPTTRKGAELIMTFELCDESHKLRK